MNILRILDSIEKIDGDAPNRLAHASRRMFMNRLSSSLAAAAVPTAFAAVVNKAFAADVPDAKAVLNYALTLEYLEETFYFRANIGPNIVDAEYTLAFAQIYRHENQHVEFLKGALGASAVKRPEFDFTAGGMFNVNDFPTVLTLAVAFEDTGVRAYKGQAANLMGTPFLEYALQVHSVEARHASLLRRIQGKMKKDWNMKGWITESKGFPADVYLGATPESNTMHGPIDAATLSGIGNITKWAITEAFDEPLTMEEVLKIAGPFVVAM